MDSKRLDATRFKHRYRRNRIGVSSRKIGRQLRAAGLLDDDEAGQRIVTEKGRQFGEMKPYKAFNGHAGYEARWRKEVLDFLTQGETA